MNNAADLVKDLTQKILLELYNHNFEAFSSYLDEDVVWIGDTLHSWSDNKKDLLLLTRVGNYTIKNSLSDIDFIVKPLTDDIIEVMVSYTVSFKYPDIDISVNRQKVMHITWVKRGDAWKISVCSRLNAGLPDLEEPLFPLHQKEYIGKQEYSYDRRIELIDVEHSSSYVPLGSIIYAESKGKNSQIHTLNGSILVPKSIRELQKGVLKTFFRPHISFLINLEYLDRIKRYSLVLLNGKEIPVPEKKYNSVKEQLDKLML